MVGRRTNPKPALEAPKRTDSWLEISWHQANNAVDFMNSIEALPNDAAKSIAPENPLGARRLRDCVIHILRIMFRQRYDFRDSDEEELKDLREDKESFEEMVKLVGKKVREFTQKRIGSVAPL
jgi:hypothetical protein